jgi:hypothetical protein
MFHASHGIAPHALHLSILSHTHACAIGCEEQEHVEQVQVEETNTDPKQGKPQCIPPTIIGFSLISIFMLCLIVH